MSAGLENVVGADPVPVEMLSVRVGGPLYTLRAEAADLLQLLTCLSEKQQGQLLVFIDSLVLLDILHKLGKASINPLPNDILYFDVIFPLLNVLRQWQYPVRLVKVKSHTGCLMNERADEQAELGHSETVREVCSAPQKYGSIWLKLS